MFLAIINDTYAEVKTDIAGQQSEFEITDYFKKVNDNNNVNMNFWRTPFAKWNELNAPPPQIAIFSS